MGIKKNIKKLLSEPSEMRFEEVMNIMIYLGYSLIRSEGSHFQFKKANERLITIPVHNMKVQKYYLKLVKSIMIQSHIYQ